MSDEHRAGRHVRILHRGGGVVAIHKPAGLPTQAPHDLDSTERRVRSLVYGAAGDGYLGVPHRLDRAVSGVMLFAETPRAARKLSRQFERREILKRYRAIVVPIEHSLAAAPVGEWQDWSDRIAKIRDEARVRIVGQVGSADDPALETARDALTRVRLIGPAQRSSVDAVDQPYLEMEFQPLTGRMHQIRVQASARGLPVLGDVLYGCGESYDESPVPDPREAAIALHASAITYRDPGSGDSVTIECRPPWTIDAL